jgi:3-deoxy-D-manno-octulosonate 8-phosphate phosphatase (KDO 8-P phosphatase)
MAKISKSLKQKLLKIRLFIFDIDGVMTDGRIILGKSELLASFDVKDGSGIVFLRRAGICVAVISGRTSISVRRRAAELGITDVHLRALRKLPVFEKLLKKYDLKPAEVAYIGDDLPDLPVLRRVGVAFAVADAVPEVKRAAHYVTSKPGGAGAVREAAELLLKAQNKWKGVVQRYLE